jgi:hypothetical protein
MKYLLILSLLVVAACSNNPIIIPDTTGDNVVMLQMKDHIAQPGGQKPSFGWLFWYIPIAAASLIAAWRYLIKKPILCDEDEDGIVDQKKPKQVQNNVE